MNFTFTLADIAGTAAQVFGMGKDNKVWAIQGEMGAGKTTFIHAVCQHLDVSGTLGSPTYSIINEYNSAAGVVYHIDLYRLKDEEEALHAGVEDCIVSGNYCFIEWPEIAQSLLPEDCLHITIKAADAETRELLWS